MQVTVEAIEATEVQRILFISGTMGLEPDGQLAERFEAQCERVWKNIAPTMRETKADAMHTAYSLARGTVHEIVVLDKDGEAIQPGGAPTLGASTSVDEWLAGDFSFRDGRAPSGPDEVALDAASAAKAGYAVGDEATVGAGGRLEDVRVDCAVNV